MNWVRCTKMAVTFSYPPPSLLGWDEQGEMGRHQSPRVSSGSSGQQAIDDGAVHDSPPTFSHARLPSDYLRLGPTPSQPTTKYPAGHLPAVGIRYDSFLWAVESVRARAVSFPCSRIDRPCPRDVRRCTPLHQGLPLPRTVLAGYTTRQLRSPTGKSSITTFPKSSVWVAPVDGHRLS